MKLTGFGAAAACTDCEASTVSAAGASVTVFSTSSPSVGVGDSESSDDGSETLSGAVVAATLETRAESKAGLCVKATPTRSAELTTIVPSSL